jgi:hypothetical protein
MSHSSAAGLAPRVRIRKPFVVALVLAAAVAAVTYTPMVAAQVRARAADDRLHALILKQSPGLAADLRAGHDYAAAREILHWVSPRVVWWGGNTVGTLNTHPLSAGQIWDKFRHRRAGVYCAGAAEFYVKTLALFGIHARYMGFGQQGIYTHATALVRLRQGWVMLDPTFDLDLRLRNTAGPVSFPNAVKLLASQRTSELVADAPPLPGRIILAPDGRVRYCAQARRTPACAFADLRYDIRVRRYGTGVAGFLSLFHDGRLLSPVPPSVAAVAGMHIHALDPTRI